MKKQKLPSLPYKTDALEPAISEKIMTLHHDKHHASYVEKANQALEQLNSKGEINYKHVLKELSFNLNGHIMHTIFWNNMQPYKLSNNPSDKLKKKLADHFGSVEEFKKQFSEIATGVEASGWAALVKSPEGELQIIQIENHHKLFLNNFTIILVIDVWEHAYYLDYENNRQEYLKNWWQVVNWSDVEERLNQ